MSISCFLFGHKTIETFNVKEDVVKFVQTCKNCNKIYAKSFTIPNSFPDKVYAYCRFKGGTDELLYVSELFKTLNQAKNKMKEDFHAFPDAANFGWKVIELMVCHET